jgi:predicted outer membrane repeat protein
MVFALDARPVVTAFRWFALAVASLLAVLLWAAPGAALPVSPQSGHIIYVNAAAMGANNGSSWAHAFNNLPAALAAAGPGDEVWVAAGVYKPSTVAADRSATFQLQSSVAVYGGFAGTEVTREQRDWQSNLTVLSGDIDNNDVTGPGGVVMDPANIVGNNSYHVVTGSGTDDTAVLDGFTITAGQAQGDVTHGAGMVNQNGSPTLANLIFSGNSANYGAGMKSIGGAPTLLNVTFSDNEASSGGGGLYSDDSSLGLSQVVFSRNRAAYGGGFYAENSNLSLSNVTFSDNSAHYSYGGGLYTREGEAALTHVLFENNSANYSGGGMYGYDSSIHLANVVFSGNESDYGGGVAFDYGNATLSNITVSGNSAHGDGGGMHLNSAAAHLTNVTFSGNSALDYGGGIYNYDGHPTLINVAFSGNRAHKNGGGMYSEYGSSPSLTNVTFSGNRAASGGGMYNGSGNGAPVIQNSIFWNNQDDSGLGTAAASVSNDTSIPTISYSLVQSCRPAGAWTATCGLDGGHNLADADPLFVETPDPAAAPTPAGNVRLEADSPAVDAGNNSYVAGVATDLDGKARIAGTAVDLGPYEWSPAYIYLPLIVKAQGLNQ